MKTKVILNILQKTHNDFFTYNLIQPTYMMSATSAIYCLSDNPLQPIKQSLYAFFAKLEINEQ